MAIKKKTTKKLVSKKKAIKKTVKKTTEEESKKIEATSQLKHQSKVLRDILLVASVMIILVFGYYLYAQSQTNFKYKGIEYGAEMQGDILFYKTITLLTSNDGTDQLFGFRLRTKPSELKRIDFEDADDLQLMKVNGYRFEDDFTCDGDGIIAVPNIQRTFNKMGSSFILDENETCDEEGRFNYFIFKAGEKTEINKIGNNCYEVIVKKESEDVCEILPATERIMIEIFSKYKEFQEE